MKSAAHHQGLSEQQVLENRTRYGINILTPPEKEPLWKQFLEKFSDPIIKILLVALLLSVGVAFYQFFTGTEPASVFLEPAGILAAILLVMLITRSPFYWTILLVWAPLLLLLAFCCGMAVLLSALAVYFRDLQYLYGILTMAWMYATPLFYPLSALPPFMVPVIKLNPLYHYINCMRCLVMYGTLPGPNTWIACIGSAVVMMGVGLAAFRKLQRNFILYL